MVIQLLLCQANKRKKSTDCQSQTRPERQPTAATMPLRSRYGETHAQRARRSSTRNRKIIRPSAIHIPGFVRRRPPHVANTSTQRNGPRGSVHAGFLAETEGFEPSMRLNTPYSLSRGAPSATRSRFLTLINYLTTAAHCQPASGPDRRLCAGRARRAPCISRQSPPRS